VKGDTMTQPPFSYRQEDLPPLEEIGDLTISPQTNLPFGKPFRMGLAIYTIYETVIETGYDAGIRAHLDYMAHENSRTPGMLDDETFTMVLDTFTPKTLEGNDRATWRAHFIAGWATVFLGLVQLDRRDKQWRE
jgi:hypothetical protein